MRVNSSRLQYLAKSRTFTGEASTLGLPPGEWPQFVDVQSAATGTVVRFYWTKENRDRDGDIQEVVYSNHAHKCMLRIFND